MLRSACCCCQLRVTIGTINSSSLPNYYLCNCSFSFPGPTSCLVREKPSPCLVTQSKQQVPLHNHDAVLTPSLGICLDYVSHAVTYPAATQVYYPTGLTASRLAACVCENIPPSTKKSTRAPLSSPPVDPTPPNASLDSWTTLDVLYYCYMVGKEGHCVRALCHWACYEFGSAHIWVRLSSTYLPMWRKTCSVRLVQRASSAHLRPSLASCHVGPDYVPIQV